MTVEQDQNSNFATPAILASLVALIVYLMTRSSSLGWHDSAELALAAWQLGASHSPGSPVHTLLGYLLALFFEEPYQGVVLLSAISAAFATAFLAFLLNMLIRDSLTAAISALIFAFSYQVWTSAVMTEIYSVSTMFLGASMLYAWMWRRSGRNNLFVGMILFYGLSLATYFANILLLPVFAYLILRASVRWRRDLAIFTAMVFVCILLIAGINYVLAGNAPPSGDVLPDSIRTMFLYMSGSQHNPLQVRDPAFILMRIAEHAGIFSKSVLFVAVPFGIFGIFCLDKIDRLFGQFLLLIFVIYFSYYTVFGPGDYYVMVTPAYYVFSIWLGLGFAGLFSISQDRKGFGVAARLLPALLVALLLIVQINGRRAMAQSMEAEEFAQQTFMHLPADAVAIVGWKEFPVLSYFQTVHRQRPDLKFILPARTIRRYSFGEIDDYIDYINVAICQYPVLSIKVLPELDDRYHMDIYKPNTNWQVVTLANDLLLNACH